MEDAEIIQKIKNKDYNAFGVLVKKYENLVFSIILKIIKNDDDTKDIAQEVFLKVFNKIDTFRQESSLATWIGRIAYNQAINAVKKQKHFQDSNEIADSSLTPSPEEQLIEQEKSNFIQKQIKLLPSKYRIALSLYHQEEMSYKEISTITQTSEASVKTNIFRARKMLKNKLSNFLN